SRKTGSADNRGDRVGPRRATVPARISLRPRVCREPALPGSRSGAKRRCEARSSFPPERLVAQVQGLGARDADILQHAVVQPGELIAFTHPATPKPQRRDKGLRRIAEVVERRAMPRYGSCRGAALR